MTSYIVKIDNTGAWERIKREVLKILEKEGGEICSELRAADALVVETSQRGFERIRHIKGVSEQSHANEVRWTLPPHRPTGL